MTTLPEKGEEIFGYKVMDQTTVSMLGAGAQHQML